MRYTLAMADQPRDIVLEYLRRIDERTQATHLDVEELKSLTNILRNDIVNVKRENDHFYQLFSRLTDRLDRIEKRLELRD
jgi:predicted  nucleic acid-binding Zn-ribbon protein